MVPFRSCGMQGVNMVKLIARKYDGDDEYSWAIFKKGSDEPVVSGISKKMIPYYKQQIQKQLEEKRRNKI